MNLPNRASRWALLPERIRGMFNLNDPRWGRGDDKGESDERPQQPERPNNDRPQGGRGRDQGPGGQPPDLDVRRGRIKALPLFKGVQGLDPSSPDVPHNGGYG